MCVWGSHTSENLSHQDTHGKNYWYFVYHCLYIYVKEQDTAADDFASSLRHYTQDIFPTFPGTPWHISLLTKTQTASSSLLTVTFHPIPVICATPPPPPPNNNNNNNNNNKLLFSHVFSPVGVSFLRQKVDSSIFLIQLQCNDLSNVL